MRSSRSAPQLLVSAPPYPLCSLCCTCYMLFLSRGRSLVRKETLSRQLRAQSPAGYQVLADASARADVSIIGVALRCFILVVEHRLCRGQLNEQRAYLSHSVVFAAQPVRHLQSLRLESPLLLFFLYVYSKQMPSVVFDSHYLRLHVLYLTTSSTHVSYSICSLLTFDFS